MSIEIAGTENRIRPASKEVQRERAVERIARTTPEDLEPSLQARREFGPQYGYASTAEWWETEQRTHDLPDELRPDWVTDDLTVSDDPVVAFVQEYDGDFEFILSLKNHLKQGRTLSDRQYAAAERSLQRETIKPVVTEDDPVIKFVLGYSGAFAFLLSLKEQLEHGRTLSDKQYSGAAKCMAKESRRSPKPEGVTEGMYRTEDGTIFKVQRAVNGSGNLYAKQLVRDVQVGNVFGAVDQGRWKFQYVQGAISKLRLEDKMTLEQAKEFGALYGTCCVCGRTLTDETSISEGIGPICAGRITEWS